MTIEEVGKLVHTKRKGNKIIQRKLAKIAGVDRWTIRKIEKGLSVTTSSLYAVCNGLGLDIIVTEKQNGNN